MDRQIARDIIASFRLEGINITVEDGNLRVATQNGPLTDEQRQILRQHKADIIEFLTIPPCPGVCYRGHPIEWVMSAYGVWLCNCYYQPYERAEYMPPERQFWHKKQSVRNHWTR